MTDPNKRPPSKGLSEDAPSPVDPDVENADQEASTPGDRKSDPGSSDAPKPAGKREEPDLDPFDEGNFPV